MNIKKITTVTTNLIIALIMLLALGYSNYAQAQSSDIAVRIAEQQDFTRLTFEFPRLTAYYTKLSDNHLKIHLDVKEKLNLPQSKAGVITALNQEIKNDMLEITVKTSSKYNLKDYRMQRRIIFDIYPIKTPTETKAVKPETKTTEPVKTPTKITNLEDAIKALPAATTAVTEQAPTATAPTPEPTKIAVPDGEVITAKNLKEVRERLARYINVAKDDETTSKSTSILSPAKDSSNEEKNIYDETPTKIAFSRLRPFKLAVFERTGILWVVTDNKDNTDEPLIEGPLKHLIPKPKKYFFDDGSAYAYILPQKFHPVAKRHGLMWEISLYNKEHTVFESASINTVFEKGGKDARMSVNLKSAGNPIKFKDPIIGDTLYVVPVEDEDNVVTEVRTNIDFTIYPAKLGMVIKPYSDILKIFTINNFVFITSDRGGLNLQNTNFAIISANDTGSNSDINFVNENRIFNFPEWSKGTIKDLHRNKIELQNMILEAKTNEEATGIILELAKLYFAHGFGQEASGMLDIAEQNNPELRRNNSFVAIRGATEALAGRHNRALDYLTHPPIQQNIEIKLWKGLAAAKTEQWTRAEREFPNNNILLLQYPESISIPITIYMAEASLRLGKTQAAEDLLNTIDPDKQGVDRHLKAAIDYLKGEIANQRGNFSLAIQLWDPVAHGVDRLYHTKAALSLTNLRASQNMFTLDEAINEVENLRFAWRGDRLEIEILNTLGRLKEKNSKPLEALEDYQKAIDVSKSIDHDYAYILENMRKIFFDLFIKDAYKNVKPLEAISIYNKFSHLYPEEDIAARIALNFSDYLIKADLLPRAAKTIEEKIYNKTMPYNLITIAGNKLAEIYLMENKPQQAIKALLATRLDKEETIDANIRNDRTMLKAKAYAQIGNTNTAITLLDENLSEKATLLKAEILWNAREWEKAANILQSIIPVNIKDLSEIDAENILNTAIAYRFSNNINALETLRDKYLTAMNKTTKAAAFQVITRAESEISLSDRETAKSIAEEATIFKNFFENYKSGK